jgi:hypothetical protein
MNTDNIITIIVKIKGKDKYLDYLLMIKTGLLLLECSSIINSK